MDRSERFHLIDMMLAAPEPATFASASAAPGSLARDLAARSGIPAQPPQRAHRLGPRDARVSLPRRPRGGKPVGPQYELPGLWFSAAEIHALLTMQHLLANLDAGGLLGPHIQPLMARLTGLLGSGRHPAEEVSKRIKLIPLAARRVPLEQFAALGSALLRRKRLRIGYYAKSNDAISEREISPQRLVHYRENWYLDAWCHLRGGLRSFAWMACGMPRVLDKAAREVAEKSLDAMLGAGYGIFSGRKLSWAKLRFSPQRARWVALEQWHPKQRGKFAKDGSYVLEMPYADDRELVMDILRHVPEVEVLAPVELREKVIEHLRAGLAGMAS
jgi:predicted DNA-binding transcriptional regulator YafY